MGPQEALNMADDILSDGNFWVDLAQYLSGSLSESELIHRIDTLKMNIRERQAEDARDEKHSA